MLFISQYSSPSESILPSLTFLSTTLQRIKIPLQFIVGDYNAHNTTWGYASTDEKGHSLEDFLSAHHLILHNSIDASPNFDRIHSSGWPDLTISSTSAASLLQNWTVEDEISLSDHRYITFTIAQPTTIQIIRRYNLPGKRIRGFTDRVKALVNDLDGQLSSANTRADLENFTVVLQRGLQQICNDLLPQRHAKKLNNIQWWNSELRSQQKKCRALRRQIKYERRMHLPPTSLPLYQQERAKYKRSILQAKLNSWHAFCTEFA
ncbi:uncharacterized protein LOC118200597 [Stegodyphus dumicola]|uniref:uncharacterized protein LOC118200597 n=1 Tax=Stegodyphus dumicola TaxID=202533 RepID=UPI0015A90016|nr:uncharacterized protein LOC118200597 [Stegodyphus dumicola]